MFRKSHRGMAVFLAVALLVGMMPTMAFAGTKQTNCKKTINYVALGDSMSQGYLFTDYNEHSISTPLDPALRDTNHKCGWKGSSKRSSIYLFSEYLQKRNKNSEVNLVDLSLQGFMPDELWALFRQYEEQDYSIGTDASLTGTAKKHFGWWVTFPDAIFESYDDMAKEYYEQIKNADVLTYDIGMNYFGSYIGNRTIDNGTEEHFTQLLDCLTERQRESLEELRANIELVLTKNNQEALAEMIDGLLYAYTSYIVYTDKCINKIFKINPDIKLIVVGLFNPHPDLSIKVGKTKVNYSKIIDLMMESLNNYITVLNKNAYRFAYADLTERTIASFADELYYYPNDPSEDLLLNVGALVNDPYVGLKEMVDCDYWDALIRTEATTDDFVPDETPYNLKSDYEVAHEYIYDLMGFTSYDELKAFVVNELQLTVDDNDYMNARDSWKFQNAILFGEGPVAPTWNTMLAGAASYMDSYPFKITPAIKDAWDKAMTENGYNPEGNKENAIKATQGALDKFKKLFGSPYVYDWVLTNLNRSAEGSEELIQLVQDSVTEYLDIFTKAVSKRIFTIEEFKKYQGEISEEDGRALVKKILEKSELSENDYAILHGLIRNGSAVRGFGIHPCPRGQEAKLECIKDAYNDIAPAKIKTAKKITKNVIEKKVEVKKARVELKTSVKNYIGNALRKLFNLS